MGEGDAEIDRDPGAIVARAIAVEGEVHADLADPAERQEDQFVLGRARHVGLSGCRKEDVAGADRLALAVLAGEHQPPGLVERLEAAVDSAAGKIDADRLADAGGPGEPRRADIGEAAAAIPDGSVPRPCGSPAGQTAPPPQPASRAPLKSPAACPPVTSGWETQLTPMPITTAKAPEESPSPSTRMPATFSAVEEQIVRPFERQTLRGGRARRHRRPPDAAPLRPRRRAWPRPRAAPDR